jgi:prephenate dehydrogenase (NADP+)
MGTAWHNMGRFPWNTGRYTRGIELAKINITLRIYSSKWHVYAGLALRNPSAKIQIDCFAECVTGLFKLMIEEKEDELRKRVFEAREAVFGFGKMSAEEEKERKPLILSDEILDKFAIADPDQANEAPPNSHLTLLAIVDCWHKLSIKPYHHLSIAATPVFRIWIGVTEYLFRSEERLNATIKAAIWNKSHRSDDTEFLIAARGWSQCISYGDFKLYEHRFEETAKFFEPMFEEGKAIGTRMLNTVFAEDNKSKS